MTDWLVEKADLGTVKQEHGLYTHVYTQARKYVLSPVSILTFADQDDQQSFEDLLTPPSLENSCYTRKAIACITTKEDIG